MKRVLLLSLIALMGLAVPLIIVKMRQWTVASARREKEREAAPDDPRAAPEEDEYRKRLSQELAEF